MIACRTILPVTEMKTKLASVYLCCKRHCFTHTCTHTYSHFMFLWTLSGMWVSQYQNQSGFTEARDCEWQWHQLGHMQICTSPQTNNHACTPPLSFLQAGCSYCHPTNSIKALKAQCHCFIKATNL